MFARRVASDIQRLGDLDAHPGAYAGKRYANLKVVRFGGALRPDAEPVKEAGKEAIPSLP